MKKIYSVILLTLLAKNSAFSQDWGDAAANCHVNAQDNTSGYVRSYRTAPREATVKIIFSDGGRCTGTLLNRNQDDSKLGYYLLTAHHCLTESPTSDNISVNFEQEHVLIFNYQSPDGNTTNTAPTNRADNFNILQSGEDFINPNQSVTDGYEYLHRTRLRLVRNYLVGDFALLEILTEVPPHFNVSYAGWNPNSIYQGFPDGSVPTGQGFDKYIGIHHPGGDIKKISTTPMIIGHDHPGSVTCYTVTTIIDFLFGWIWKRKFSTQVICNPLVIPIISVPTWHAGVMEGGSSGSGLFNMNNKLIGQLSGGLDPVCNSVNYDPYGKFRFSYIKADVKNALNPSSNTIYNRATADIFGIGSRKITCYDNLDLPGASGVSGHYFPASHYQPENTILLQSKNNITTNAPIRVYNGADYRFKAANVIDIDDFFEAEPGSYVEMDIGNCGGASKEPSPESILAQRLQEYKLPKEKKLDMQRFGNGQLFASPDKQSYLQIFPNPTTGAFKLRFSENGNYQVVVKDVAGRQVAYQQANNVKEMLMQIDVLPGQYFVNVIDENGRMQYGKLSIVK
ncbi:MAG TPA: T9SS type A sorting domain-containing protein [Flavipsychrobacter sp.]|nr:T9SS type A sorting domain-containing protein [Flavipsychrobacter sp.]